MGQGHRDMDMRSKANRIPSVKRAAAFLVLWAAAAMVIGACAQLANEEKRPSYGNYSRLPVR